MLVLEMAPVRAMPRRPCVRRLDSERAYQLHHVRPFSAVVGSPPEPQRAFELGPAMVVRARLLFGPLAAAARAELGLWGRVLEGIERMAETP